MTAERVKSTREDAIVAAESVRSRIIGEWKDERVARWVISQLPLLELAGSCPPVPIFDLDFETGLTVSFNEPSLVDKFRNANKVVISGGFEGNSGHVRAVDNMRNVARVLSLSTGMYITALLLERDGYVRKLKHREPMLTCDERMVCWSTLGIVDFVVGLPVRDFSEDVGTYFQKVRSIIGPAEWCASIENPAWREIITRDESVILDGTLLLDHEASTHMSFIDSTKDMGLDEFIDALCRYSASLADTTVSSQLLEIYGGRDRYARLVFERLLEGCSEL